MKSRGFTLVEIMIVVAIIGMLAMMAIPSFMKARKKVQTNIFISDIRTATDAFVLYSMDNYGYPPDVMPSVIPPGMAPYLKNMNWTGRTAIGGKWDWDYKQFGYLAGVSVYLPNRNTDEMREIDARIDDGNLNTGNFRQRNQGFIYIIEF